MSQTVGQYLGEKGPVINQHEVTNAYRDRWGETFRPAPGAEVTNAYAYEHALPGETVGEARERLGRWRSENSAAASEAARDLDARRQSNG